METSRGPGAATASPTEDDLKSPHGVDSATEDGLKSPHSVDSATRSLASDTGSPPAGPDSRKSPLASDSQIPTRPDTSWEIDVCYQNEADLHQHYAGCRKNPGHASFIPAHEFNMNHLPLGFQDNDILDYVRVVSDLTAQVKVSFISIDRPDVIPNSDKPYPCHNMRGSKAVTVGTGWIRGIVKYPNEISEGVTCQCKECSKSQAPRSQFAVIIINTAAHVVFDAPEAASATCNLFYDKGNLPSPRNGVVTLQSFSCVVSNVEADQCEMTFVTHDLDLASRIDDLHSKRTNLQMIINKKSAPIRYYKEKTGDASVVHPLTFIASHPHGCSKQITIGQCVSIDIFDNRHIQRLYDTATCPGSSGAQVVVIGTDPWEKRGKQYIHRGSHGARTEFNYSGLLTEDFLLMGTLTLTLQDWKRQGSWEAEFTYRGETDLHHQIQMCDGNPGHKKFIPIEVFTVDSLPLGYRDNNIVNYIQAVSDLTARVSVRYVSQRRPPTMYGSQQPYPWFSSRGSCVTRVGSGWVGTVMIYDNEEDFVCECQECQRSARPKTQFAYVYIQTAAHVVFDKSEVVHATVNLFLDRSGAAASTGADVITLTGLSDVYAEVQEDRCEMTYVTHDLCLAKKLHTMTETRYKLLKILDNYRLYSSENEEERFNLVSSAGNSDQLDTAKIRNEHSLTVVVSHPHGCNKQVSIGYSGDLDDSPDAHTAPVCPGCSGAPVFMLGVETFFAYQNIQS